MKNQLLFAVALACGVLFAGSASAQIGEETGVLFPEEGGGILVGPVGGINLVSYSTASFAILETEPDCFQAQNGSDVAPFAGLSVEIPLGQGMQNFIIAEAIYDSKSSKFTSVNENRTDVQTKLDGEVGPGNVTTSLTADVAYLLLNAGYKYNFVEGPAPVGPGVQLVASVGLKMTNKLNETVTVSAVKVGSATVTNSATNEDAEAMRIGLRAQFTYDIPLSQTWIATPTAGYDLALSKVDDSIRDWKASSAFGGVALRYLIR
jgi:hypothetical protein